MTSGGWCLEELASGCWRSEYQYEGPGSTQRGNEFTIHATLDAGAQNIFSGVRVILCCKDVQEGPLHGLTIKDNVGSPTINRSPKARGEAPKILSEQLNGKKLAERWRQGDTDKGYSLPLCTLIFEIVDISDETWTAMKLILLPPPLTEQSLSVPFEMCTLYEYIQPSTPSSPLVLFLATNQSFRRTLKANNPQGIACAYPARMGIYVHGVRILPPDSSRKRFINLPPELLLEIFEHAVLVQKRSSLPWRGALVSLALVCRAWRPALKLLFRDLSVGGRNAPDATQVSTALERNPGLGRGIRVFRQRRHWSNAREISDEKFLEFSRAVLTILHAATLAQTLEICATDVSLAEEFVHALCRSPDVQELSVSGGTPPSANKRRYILSIADILRCIAHWSLLHSLVVFGFSASTAIDDTLVSICKLATLVLQEGHLSDLQLISLTSSSHTTLQDVSICQVSGLTNQGLRNWLAEVGPALRSLMLKQTSVSRRTDDEEYAIDAMLPIMDNLHRLDLEGDVASELVLMRKPATGAKMPKEDISGWWRSSLAIENAPGVNEHGFVSALKSTEWTMVKAHGAIMPENIELKEEANKIAKDRNIYLFV